MSTPIQNAKVQGLLQGRTVATTNQVGSKTTIADRTEFDSILEARLKLSGHAKTRLASRNIELDRDAWERVIQGVDKAAQKGARESLVMLDDVALVVSIKNRTVITAVDRERLKENVFTNIDSAVIV
jgi:flagellar operon protein